MIFNDVWWCLMLFADACWLLQASFFFPLSPGHVNLPFGFDQPWHLWCKQNKVEMVGFPCLGLLHHLSQIGSGTQHVWKTRWPTPLLAFALGQCYATHWSTTCGCNPFWCRKWSESKGLKWFQFWSSRVERLFAHGNSLWDLWHVPKFYHNWFFSSCPLMQRLCKPWSFTPVQSKVDASNFSPSSRKASIDFRQSWEKQHWEIGNGRSIKELYNENAFTRTYHCILESLLTYQQHYIKWMFDDFCHFWIAIGHGKLLVLMTSEERIVALGLEEPPQ